MPTLSRIDYNTISKKADEPWTVYADVLENSPDSFTEGHNFLCCDYTRATFRDFSIGSIFEKCNLEKVFFINCTILPSCMFIDCCLLDSCFLNCIFKTEEQLIFLKMSGVKIFNCLVEGKDEPEYWNV